MYLAHEHTQGMEHNNYALYVQSRHRKELAYRRLRLDSFRCTRCGTKTKPEAHCLKCPTRLKSESMNDLFVSNTGVPRMTGSRE